ncbi:MAG: P-II family nitrogen regulator [Elusimicrobia bacterium]|nr:P-II family nitrogen regulator [Elusimicrobiota bacterium]MBP9127272.1 P-II family nitrogen regulator [Elusimicrobiota bacterium]MBP9698792.1 P-II family nitrogen regulator [Elusimicrobiota bacterium]
MKMIRAIVRPEKEEIVVKALEEAGFPSITKFDVLGRGKQKGLQIANSVYDELAKSFLMIVVEDAQAPRAVEAIQSGARTGNFGDGKIFVTQVEQAYTIRTGKEGL